MYDGEKVGNDVRGDSLLQMKSAVKSGEVRNEVVGEYFSEEPAQASTLK
jgi:hypothetical protein